MSAVPSRGLLAVWIISCVAAGVMPGCAAKRESLLQAAAGYHSRAQALRTSGDAAQAAEAYVRAVEAYRQYLARSPDDDEAVRDDLASVIAALVCAGCDVAVSPSASGNFASCPNLGGGSDSFLLDSSTTNGAQGRPEG
jgi:hypothetical protein